MWGAQHEVVQFAMRITLRNPRLLQQPVRPRGLDALATNNTVTALAGQSHPACASTSRAYFHRLGTHGRIVHFIFYNSRNFSWEDRRHRPRLQISSNNPEAAWHVENGGVFQARVLRFAGCVRAKDSILSRSPRVSLARDLPDQTFVR